MNSNLIRHKFLDFFKNKGHQVVPSAPLVLKNDPTLLFTNSGMVQFKDHFLGNVPSKYNRIVDTQKCLRVSGKHNDLEEVGLDTYHHTMFEMLGNWSFGDYFKKEAIEWAWELLTKEYKLPKERLYVSVFGGDKSEKLPIDKEAFEYWKPIVGADRIVKGSKKDNFWEMGETGPCGPCSEIHIDLRNDDEVSKNLGIELVNKDHPQVIEIWNLVFMEFNRKSDGSLSKLPAQHVDTGMGFERLCMAIQGKQSNYDTDIFQPLIQFIAHQASSQYGADEKKDIAIRVIADHVRAVSFAISDGQLPSNTGAGYVIRRILRRAVRYGYSYLNFREPFIYQLVSILSDQLKDVFPELHQQREYVERVIHEEESSFLSTLDKGLKRLEQLKVKDKKISGELAFELYDTFGFPFDLTSLIARERGLEVDEEVFLKEMAKQKSRSKADAVKDTGDWIEVRPGGQSEFVGYDKFETPAHLIKYRKINQKNQEFFQLVFTQTPFYGESGGQVGDTGTISAGTSKINVFDTKKEGELIVHYCDKLPTKLDEKMVLQINHENRTLTVSNHSATHLLHAALRSVLGKHVEQKGSLVNSKMLRFDFSHFSAMIPSEILMVEQIVNARIRANIPRGEKRAVPIATAKEMGAMALFGEKYGDVVRVISFDPKFSIELCGGTHVESTGSIGFFKIIGESSIAAGVRRIEAVTSQGSEDYLQNELELLNEVRELFRNPKDLVSAAQMLIEEKHVLEKKLQKAYYEKANLVKQELIHHVKEVNGSQQIIERVSLPDTDSLKDICYALRNQFEHLILVLAAEIQEKPQIAVMIGEKLMDSKKYHAGQIVKELAKEIDGGGGGQPFYATAGGSKLEGLDRVLLKAKEMLS